MERLRWHDLQTFLMYLPELYAQQDLDGFPTHILSILQRLVPAGHISYNRVNLRNKLVSTVIEPPDTYFPSDSPEAQQIFDRHMSEHPLIAHHEESGDGRAVKVSDFLTQGQFHRLELFQEFYRMMDVEHQMAIVLPAAPCYMIGIALSPKRPDFSERDRLLLNLIRPHLIQAYRNAAALTRLRHGVGRLDEAMEAVDCGIMLLSSQGRVLWMTGRARRCVGEYFKPSPNWGPQLPESLARWVKRQQALLGKGDEMPPLLGPLAVEREGKR